MKSCLIEAINWLWFLIMAVPFMPSLFVNSATFGLWTWYKLKAFNRFMQAWWDANVPRWVQPLCTLLTIVGQCILFFIWLYRQFS